MRTITLCFDKANRTYGSYSGMQEKVTQNYALSQVGWVAKPNVSDGLLLETGDSLIKLLSQTFTALQSKKETRHEHFSQRRCR